MYTGPLGPIVNWVKVVFNNFGRESPKDHYYKVSIISGYWLRSSRLLKQKLTDGRRVIRITYLVSLRLSGELKVLQAYSLMVS